MLLVVLITPKDKQVIVWTHFSIRVATTKTLGNQVEVLCPVLAVEKVEVRVVTVAEVVVVSFLVPVVLQVLPDQRDPPDPSGSYSFCT